MSKKILMQGNQAVAEAALVAGVKVVAGYPITPSSEVVELLSRKLPAYGGRFIQMEDEIASIGAIIGASAAGKKAMTATSGPGFSLMQELLGYAAMVEIPIVIYNAQRVGPSTGGATKPQQGDIMQTKWGSHGDYEIIAISPDSPQELFDYTIKAFNLAEIYRCPVMIMSDECVGHMTEKVVVPTSDKIDVEPRRFYEGSSNGYFPFKPDKDLVPKMAKAGDGFKLYITSQLHDEKGHPVKGSEYNRAYTRRLVDKIRLNKHRIIELREDETEDADVIVIAYGITSRVAARGIEKARDKGIKVGSLRLVTVFPFPDETIARFARKVKAFVVPEINYGQIAYEVQRCCAGKANVVVVPHGGSGVHHPADILNAIEYAAGEDKNIPELIVQTTRLEKTVFQEGYVVKE